MHTAAVDDRGALMGDHALVILAAGGSVRLGRPKQLLTRDGEPLLRRATRLGLATRPRRAIVVLGACHDDMAPALSGVACEIVVHAAWRDGIAASIRAAAARLADHRGSVLMLICDQPALAAHHLDALLAGAAVAGSGCAAVSHGTYPGVPAVVPVAMLAAAASAGDAGLGARLRSLPAASMFVLDAPELAFDIDTPADLRRAVSLGLVDHAAW